jgi:hypothetical protein
MEETEMTLNGEDLIPCLFRLRRKGIFVQNGKNGGDSKWKKMDNMNLIQHRNDTNVM